MTFRNYVLASVGIAFLFMCVWLLPPPSSESSLKIGYVNTGLSKFVVSIIENESDTENIDFVGFSNPTALNVSLVNGKLDIALAVSSNAVAKAREKGHKLKYIFPNVLNSTSIIVKKESSVKSINDLLEKKVGWYGLPTSGGTAFFLITQHYEDTLFNTIKFTETKPPLLQPILDNGDVDAVILFEPFTTRMIASGNYREIGKNFNDTWKDINGNPLELSGIAVQEDWLNKNEYMALHVIDLWKGAVLRVKNEPKKYIQKYSDALKLTGNTSLNLAVVRIPYLLVDDWGSLDIEINTFQNRLYKAGKFFELKPELIIKKLDD
jgi:ABC-type nitrate/sulfonate/bicarbonate transport system substrate-binding protein